MALPFEMAEYEDRLGRLRAIMDRKDLSALLLFAAPKQSGNVRWIDKPTKAALAGKGSPTPSCQWHPSLR